MQQLRLTQPLLTLLQKHGMKMALPKDIPTLHSQVTGNYTRVNQVFLDEDLLQDLIVCSTLPSLCPLNTNHFPVMTTLMVDTPQSSQQPRYNFKDVDWEEFQDRLAEHLAHTTVPHEMVDIEDFKSYHSHHQPDHPCHEEYHKACNLYVEAQWEAHSSHWAQFLENLSNDNVWTVSDIVSGPPTDGANLASLAWSTEIRPHAALLIPQHLIWKRASSSKTLFSPNRLWPQNLQLACNTLSLAGPTNPS
ncbi:hypothetical protein BDQ17DRAFT_1427453 [Cyathus striatus]|nr:hypothetical protein BDQ17DRAFT_1427453 [Cyathus striatus]